MNSKNLEYSRFLDTQKVTDHPHLLVSLDDLLTELGLKSSSRSTELSRGLSNVCRSERGGSERIGEGWEIAGAERRPTSRSAVKLSPASPLCIRSRDDDLYRDHAQRILLDLLEAALVDREGWVRYRRDRNAYRPGEVLHARGFSYDAVCNIVNAMKPGKLGWIEHADGYYPRNEDGKRKPGRLSRMRASDLLLARFGDVDRGWIRHEPLPPSARIIVKDQDKERIPAPDSGVAERLRDSVLRTQALADFAEVELRLPPEGWEELRRQMREGNVLLDLSGRSLFRVFNDADMEKGGRYYGPAYQGIPSRLRCWYYLNSQPTVELDFKCLHPSILYAEAFEPIPDDCYDLPGYDRGRFRPLIKRALNVFINAKTRAKAAQSLVFRWEMERTPNSGIRREKHVWASLPEVQSKKEAFKRAGALLDALKEHHAPIADKFGSDEGKRLQGVDASIAGRVLFLTASIRCPVMIFHDGFRVIHTQAEQVWKIMRSEFRVRFHQDIKVEAKGATPPLPLPEFSDLNVGLFQKLSAAATNSE